jgi:hypothetical protein
VPRTWRRAVGAVVAFLTAGTLAALPVAGSAWGAEAAWVAGVNGAPTVTRAGRTEPLGRGDAVAIGDTVTTDDAAKVKLLLADDSVLTIGPRTQVTIDELLLGPGERKGRVRVLAGRFKMAVAAWLTGPSAFEVATPTAIAGVRGTVLWGDTEIDTICALEGNVEVRAVRGKAVAKLATGHCVTKMGSGEPVPVVPGREQLERYLKEVALD